MTTPLQPPTRHHPPHRAHESPLTFLRSRERQVVSEISYWADETFAVLAASRGAAARNKIFARQEIGPHEGLDTLAVRRLQRFFTWIEIGKQQGSPQEGHLDEIPEDQPDSAPSSPSHRPLAAVGRRSPRPETSYCLFFRESPAALGILEHAIERILAVSDFLRDPANAWVCPPHQIHIPLTSTAGRKQGAEDREMIASLISATSPITLNLHRLVWRRNGTLWAQWAVEKGNIDRLRADLRIATGTSHQFEMDGEDPTKNRPLAVESLIMAVVHTPSGSDFRGLRAVTDVLNEELSGTRVEFLNVLRVSGEVTPIDRVGVSYDKLSLMREYPRVEGDINRILWGLHLIRWSPSVRRIALQGAAATGISLWAGWMLFGGKAGVFDRWLKRVSQ